MISVPMSLLKAAFLLAPKKDIREYLNGVRVVSTSDCTRIITTDGASLFSSKYFNNTNDVAAFTIPYDTVAYLIKQKAEWLDIAKTGDGYQCRGLVFSNLSDYYPDVDRVIPKLTDKTTDCCYFDWEKLGVAQKALRTATGNNKSYFKLIRYGTSSSVTGVMRSGDDSDTFVIVMGLRE